ncbi:MAG: LysE family translocator, partial [Kiloniellales bacterium]|nr:LysE family translocator [Kiloniellales bacterium]
IAHSLAFGWRRALNTVLGATCGVAVQLSVALVGMTSFLLLMADWFEWLRWAGVAYLVYLGVQQWRAEPEAVPAETGQARGRALLLQSLMVTTANPKTLIFFAAFFPQFIDPATALSVQLPLLAVTFLAITYVFTAFWAVVAGRAGRLFRTPRRIRLRNRLTGGLLVCAGLGLSLARRV